MTGSSGSVPGPPGERTRPVWPGTVWGRLHSYSFVVPYSVPFWGPSTYSALFRSLLGGQLIEGPTIAALTRRLEERFGGAGVRLFGSGRAAMEAGLRTTPIGPGDEIVLPDFGCESLLTPVLAVGATPVFADVGPELNVTPGTIAPCLTSRTRAVIVPHLFGNPADVAGVSEIARGRGIVVVDDAAQALGATNGGKPVGTGGHWGILSFGNGKVCTGTGGGALLSADPSFLDRADRMPHVRPRPLDAAARALSTLVWRRWRRWTLPVLVAGNRLFGESKSRTLQRVEAPRNIDAAVALTLLDTLEANLVARRKRVRIYEEQLSGEERIRLFRHREGSACLSQVVGVIPGIPGGAAAERLRDALLAAGYEVTRSYKPLHLVGGGPGVGPPTPFVEGLWMNLLELPCEPSVPLREVTRICGLIRRVLD